ncbi:MAG TPA: hypothetical protein VM348_11705 [Brevundimonas sp.]|nr:hypothetical protein [Brevundimonas sp.]
MSKSVLPLLRRLFAGLTSVIVAGFAGSVLASDHLDTPSVIADPRADIGDLYAWTSQDGRRLNLAMSSASGRTSDRL